VHGVRLDRAFGRPDKSGRVERTPRRRKMSRDKGLSNGSSHGSMNQPWPKSKAALKRVLRAKEVVDNHSKKQSTIKSAKNEYDAAVAAYDNPASVVKE
jgi:hypothetical protein